MTAQAGELPLAGLRTVVTGASSGIGAAIAEAFAAAGATVGIGYWRSREAAEALAARFGPGNLPLRADLSTVRGCAEIVEAAFAALGQIDVWVNNAGIYPNTEFVQMTVADWDRVMEVNVRGAFAGSQAAAKHMLARGAGGVIINLSSINGYRAFGVGIAHYTTTKHALLGLTKSLAVELGPHNIRVLALAPTMVETEGVAELRKGVDDSEFGAAMAALAGAHPLGRVGVPDDVARVALFCASDLAAMMSGSSVVVDGGYLAL